MKMWASNLIRALTLAIAEQEKIEKAKGFTAPSAMRSGWDEVRFELLAGRPVEIQIDDEYA